MRNPIVHIILVCFLFFEGSFAFAQAPAPRTEYWWAAFNNWLEANETESVQDELFEILDQLIEHPINLNDTLSERRFLLPFVDDYQWEMVRYYIQQNGPLYSKNELLVINNWDTNTLLLALPFLTTLEVTENHWPTGNELLHHGTNRLMTGWRRGVPPTNDSSFLGSPDRMYFKYYYRYRDRIELMVSGDKDPGEEFFRGSNRQGFDFYGYHLFLNNLGPIKRAIFGRYNLQFGQGLTLWSGFRPWISESSGYWRSGQGVAKSSAFCEYGSFRGLASTIQIRSDLDFTSFFSYNSLDASVKNQVDEFGEDFSYAQTIYETGYHRTEKEIEKKDQLFETLLGGQIHWRRNGFSSALTAYGSIYDKPLLPASNTYNQNYFRGKENLVAGLDASYRYRNALFFGELSASHTSLSYRTSLPLAGLIGLEYNIDTRNHFGITYRNYSPSYQNLHSGAIGVNSRPQNESGFSFNFHTIQPNGWDMAIFANIYKFKNIRYQVYSPSGGMEGRLRISKELKKFKLSGYYRYRKGEKNISRSAIDTLTAFYDFDPHLFAIENTQLHKAQFSVNYFLSENWNLSTFLTGSLFNSDHHHPQTGWLWGQDVSYNISTMHKLTLSERTMIFNVDGYDSRIYSQERNLAYEYYSPMLMGKGIRGYLLLRWEPTEKIALATRISTTWKDALSESKGESHTMQTEIKLQLWFRW